MSFEGHFETKTSKAGNPYEVLVIKYKEFETDVYLTKAEIQLLRLISKNDKEEPEMPFLNR